MLHIDWIDTETLGGEVIIERERGKSVTRFPAPAILKLFLCRWGLYLIIDLYAESGMHTWTISLLLDNCFFFPSRETEWEYLREGESHIGGDKTQHCRVPECTHMWNQDLSLGLGWEVTGPVSGSASYLWKHLFMTSKYSYRIQGQVKTDWHKDTHIRRAPVLFPI